MSAGRPEVLVVGAGIIGASIAAALARRGASVLVIEDVAPGAGTSGATFSWVNAVGKSPRDYFDLNYAGIQAHRRLAVDLGGEGEWYHPSGNLEWSLDETQLDAKVAALVEWGYAVERVDVDEARRIEPAVSIPDDAAIAWYPQDAWVDAVILVLRLLAQPSIVVRTEVSAGAIATDGGRAIGVDLVDGGRIEAATIVVAAGPRSPQLLRSVDVELPMRHAPGLLAVTGPCEAGPSRIVHAPGIAVRPEPGGRLMLASDGLDKRLEPVGGDLSVESACATLLERLALIAPQTSGLLIEEPRVGLRAITTDGHPAIGPVSTVEGVYVAVMHSGVTLAPVIGDLVADEVLDGPADSRLEPYRLDRFIRSAAGEDGPRP